MLEVKFEYNINRVREAIADCENVHTGKETLNVQPEEYDEGELIDIVSKVVVIKR